VAVVLELDFGNPVVGLGDISQPTQLRTVSDQAALANDQENLVVAFDAEKPRPGKRLKDERQEILVPVLPHAPSGPVERG
jgi:hypothetical protein